MAHLQGNQAENQEHSGITASELQREATDGTDARNRTKLDAEAVSPPMAEPGYHVESQHSRGPRISANVARDTINPHNNNSVKAQANKVFKMVEALSGNLSDQRSLLDIFSDCISAESPLAYSIRQLSRRKAKVRLLSGGGYVDFSDETPDRVLRDIIESKAHNSNVLVIHDVDNEWCEALRSRFPDSMNRLFLTEHLFGFALPLSPETPYAIPHNRTKSNKSIQSRPNGARVRSRLQKPLFDFIDILWIESDGWVAMGSQRDFDEMCDRLKIRKLAHGFHINCWRNSQSRIKSDVVDSRQFQLRRTHGSWDKTHGFISCCRLAGNLCRYITSMLPVIMLLR